MAHNYEDQVRRKAGCPLAPGRQGGGQSDFSFSLLTTKQPPLEYEKYDSK